MTRKKRQIIYYRYLWKQNKKQFFEILLISIRSRLLWFWNPNFRCRALTERERNYKQLKKKYCRLIDGIKYYPGDELKPQDYTIWVCWLQGIENAPRLVRVCVENIRRKFEDYSIIIITEKNYQEYADIPTYILDKWKSGIISNAHFSDIIRLFVLEKYGGVWIDSTVYCTVKRLPDYVTAPPLFLFSNITLNGLSVSKVSNWMIASRPHNSMILSMKMLLLKYWEDYDYVLDYFIFHLLFNLVIDNNKDEWDTQIKYNNLNPHILQLEFGSQYCDSRMYEICRYADFHKLTYKLEKKCNHPGTFYDKLINDEYEVTSEF